MAKGLTQSEASAWSAEMIRIITDVVYEVIDVADQHNIERDDAIQYFSELFSIMGSVSTFEHFCHQDD